MNRMIKLNIDLTDSEYRALRTCIIYSTDCCTVCCAYPEIQKKKVQCKDCAFTKDRESLILKLNEIEKRRK